MTVNTQRSVPSGVDRVPGLRFQIKLPYCVQVSILGAETADQNQSLGLSVSAQGQRVTGQRQRFLFRLFLYDLAPTLILQTKLPEVAKGVVGQSLHILVLHRQAAVNVDLLPAVHDLGSVEVAALRHGRLRRGLHCHRHPRVVLRVEQPDIIQRSVAERVTAEHPQAAASVGHQTVPETRQCLSQMVQMISQVLRIEELGEDQLMILESDGAVATAVARRTDAATVTFVANAALLGGGAVVRTDLHIAVDADEAGLAQAVAVTTLAVSRTAVARHHYVARVETLHLVQLLVVHRQKAGLGLYCHRIIGAFCTIHANQLTLMAAGGRDEFR